MYVPTISERTLTLTALFSAASRRIFGTVWTVWAPKKYAQKVLVTLLPYLFHIKTKRNIVYVYLKTKIFSRDINILPKCV